MTSPFRSAPPRVRLVQAFSTPVRNAMATARTCYSSKGLIDEETLQDRDKYIGLAKSVFGAGHHTVFQHAHFQFAIENVSRQFLWSFLHAHPFYNSEQVSQRYVAVKEDNMAIPDLSGKAMDLYRACIHRQFQDYRRLCEILMPTVESAYRRRFPASARQEAKHTAAMEKRAQEVARYVLPVATHAYLYHTVSAVTVLRYLRTARQFDCPTETLQVAEQMTAEIVRIDPDFAALVAQPLDPEAMPEWNWLRRDDLFSLEARNEQEKRAAGFIKEFDHNFKILGPRRGVERGVKPASRRGAILPGQGDFFADFNDGGAVAESAEMAESRGVGVGGGPDSVTMSRLVAWQDGAEKGLARAVREVLGLPAASLSDDDAIALALDPARNRLLGETLNVTTLHKLTRALYHPHYTFLKRISHTADSQDQRHRMAPGSRPFLVAHLTERPDYVVPELATEDPRVERFYRDSMERTWEAIRSLRRLGVEDEWTAYLLPNSVVVRFTESADLLNLRHKLEMRLCYNSQEEIWRASVEEARQIAQVHPRVGRLLLPPCTLRLRAGVKPYCPEGPRYCGVRVWTLDVEDYERQI